MRLGTYSTFDCPTKKEDEALVWLQAKFEVIGGTVRKVMNPHDFGMYPSFEIDYPEDVEDANDFVDTHQYDEMDEETEKDYNKQQEIADDWSNKANVIETEYNKEFEEYL